MRSERSHPPLLRVPEWDDIPQLLHGFFGARGGVSWGTFAELNLSLRVGDEAGAVHENWRRVSLTMGCPMRFATMTQVHGNRVVTLDGGKLDAGEADAVVTRQLGVALGILTADCVPILLVAPRHGVVAAVHAGWRGTLAGIAPEAVHHLHRIFGAQPEEIRAALGPAIAACCYEIDAEIADDLEDRWGAMTEAVQRRRVNGSPAKALLDLRLANRRQLIEAGVRAESVACVGPCTRCAGGEYFSHRASGGRTGRQLSFIAWKSQLGKDEMLC